MDTISINNYRLEKPLTSDNSGFSKWGIGVRGDGKYFIKEFLSPIYPAEDAVFSEKKKQERIRQCDTFVEEKKKLYAALREADDGHIVAPEQFFRVGGKYYISTKAYTDRQMTVSELQRCDFVDRLRICCTVAHSMARIHEKNIVHADIKPDNVLIIGNNIPRPYIIDFDCSFFVDKCPKLGEELNGDMVYLSPEGYLHIAEMESNLSCKMDVFALGLLFHQYLTGQMPLFNQAEYQYAYETVLDGNILDVSKIGNVFCRNVIDKMLVKNPKDRPDMASVFKSLNSLLLSMLDRSSPKMVETETAKETAFFQPAGDLL